MKQIRIAEQSEILYKKEGDRAFGNFYFGMSKKDFSKQVDLIKKETGGYVSIDGSDFYIELKDCYFFHDKLYEITLISKNQDHIEYEMTPEEQRSHIDFYKSYILTMFADKYGEAHDDSGWHFLHKDITVYYTRVNPFADENTDPYRWGIIIHISQPKLAYQAADEQREINRIEQEAKERRDSIERVKRDKLQKKKESMVEGI